MNRFLQRGLWPLSVLAVAALSACGGGGGDSGQDSTYQAEIRRTSLGVPHIKASNWGNLGYGYGYAQAQDTLCTMADAFLTYRGERSQYLGGDALAVNKSTIGRPKNLDSDFFFRHVVSDDVLDTMAAAQSADMRQLVSGFTAGYNRYLRDLKSSSSAHAACRDSAWVKPITERDLLRRAYAANLAAGYSNFVTQIATGAPAGALQQSRRGQQSEQALTPDSFVPPALEVGGSAGIGSNMYGFAPAATGDASPVMFGNPHWYWKGGDRFYQAQLTIPGQLNVSGASFLGLPMIQIGFNDNVAWSHTVSTARRFGLFELTLAPNDPSSYLVDGQPVKMTANTLSVQVLQPNGSTAAVQRTLYKTAYGPLINLSGMNAALSKFTFAIRDINGQNFRSLRNWMRWNMAGSLDEFMKIQKEEAAIPWVNTVAVARGSSQAWYADIGAVPNVPDQKLADCTTAVGKLMASAVPNVPILDGARSACEWSTDADSVQKGAIGVARMPSLLRSDYVGNMNDSYWLANPKQPLTGYPAIFGSAGTASQSLRTRLGHTMALERLAGTDGYAGNKASSDIVRQMVLNSRMYPAERFKGQVLGLLCNSPASDIAAACAALTAWDNKGNVDSRGSHVWDEFWGNAMAAIKEGDLYSVPFSAADPLNTPRDINPAAAVSLRQALLAAVQKVQASGFALDAARGELLFSVRGGKKIALYGGCGPLGYFTIACSENPLNQGGYSMDGQPHGNTYMHVVSFPKGGVEAYTFLTFSLSDDPASAHYADYTQAYAAKQWLRLPFSEAEITADKNYQSVSLKE